MNQLQHERMKGVASLAICVVVAVVLHAGVAYGETLRAKIHEGNALYEQGLYDKALEAYNDAQVDSPDSAELHFNIGNVKYREEDYENTIDTYQKSFKTKDIKLEAKAYYNTGNAKYRAGEKTSDIALWREAMEYYKRAIELDPDDEDAKFNLEFVEQKIKETLSKQQEEQQQQDKQQKEQQQEQKEESESSQSEQQDRQEQQASEQGEEEKEEEKAEEKQQEQMAAAQPEPQQMEEEQAQAQPDEEKEEELPAQEIFSILQSEEEAARDQARAAAARYQPRVLKDW